LKEGGDCMIEEKILENGSKIKVFRSNDNLVNTIDGEDIYLELHEDWDSSRDFVDIEINTAFRKESLKFLIEVLQEFYGQMDNE